MVHWVHQTFRLTASPWGMGLPGLIGGGLLVLVGQGGCSSAGEQSGLLSGSDFSEGAESSSETAWDEGPAAEAGGDEAPEPVGEDSSGGAEAPSDGEGGQVPGTGPGRFEDCPQRLPEGWIVCEDFESIAHPADIALDFQDFDGAFTLVEGIGASGDRALQVNYRQAQEGAGWMMLSFGESPIDHDQATTFAPEQTFTEIYWRLRVMNEPGWPDIGSGQLTRTIAFAQEDWAEALVVHLRSSSEDLTLEALPVTCVVGSEVPCNGYDDQTSLKPLTVLKGQSPLYGSEYSGQWHCVEGHLRLNTPVPSVADGALEFWIDGELQARRDDLDLRGAWAEYGINALAIENHWPGGAPAPLRRWIDDLVISSERIGCHTSPEDTVPAPGA